MVSEKIECIEMATKAAIGQERVKNFAEEKGLKKNFFTCISMIRF